MGITCTPLPPPRCDSPCGGPPPLGVTPWGRRGWPPAQRLRAVSPACATEGGGHSLQVWKWDRVQDRPSLLLHEFSPHPRVRVLPPPLWPQNPTPKEIAGAGSQQGPGDSDRTRCTSQGGMLGARNGGMEASRCALEIADWVASDIWHRQDRLNETDV